MKLFIQRHHISGLTKSLVVIQSAILATFSLAIPTSVSAQTTLEEVVVTAQFREERLQDTPIAITAVTEDMMRARSMDSLHQVTQFAPNVQLRPAPGPFGTSLNAFIRGIGQDDFEFAREPGVGMYIDDVYFPTLTGSIFEVLDLERVEVLRGPQGTLRGRNNIGGSVSMITRKPTGDGPGFVELTYGEFERIAGKGAAEFTILPGQLFARIAGVFNFKDGFQDRIDFACARPGDAAAMGIPSSTVGFLDCEIGTLGGQSYGAGRASVRWTPNDRLEVNLIGDLTNDDSEPPAQTLLGVGRSNFPFDPTGNFAAATGQIYDERFIAPDIYTTYETFDNRDLSQNAPFSGSFPPGASSTSLTGPWAPEIVHHLQTWGIAGIIDYEFNDRVSAKTIVSYRELDNKFPTSSDGSPLGVETGSNNPFGDSLQVEGRLNAALFDGKVDTTVGVFWFEQDNRNTARINIPYSSGPGFLFDFITDQTYESESLGIYGHAVWHVNDRLNLTGGIRYSDEEKVQDLFRIDPATGLGASNSPAFCLPLSIFAPPGTTAIFPPDPNANCVDPVTGFAGGNIFETERVDWRASIDYRWTEEFMTYFTYSTGFKAGGVSPRFFFLTHIIPYEEEELQSFDVGFKSDLLDNRLRLNAAGFYNIYEDQQLGAFECPNLIPTAPCLADQNLADSDVWGFELEATFVPTERMLIDASVSWINMEFTRVDPLRIPPNFNIDADVPEQTPEWKWSIGAQYEYPLGAYGSLTPRIDVSWQDEVRGFGGTGTVSHFNPADITQGITLDSYTLVNARVTWRSADEDWEMAFALTNATDEEYFFNLFDISAVGAWASARPAPPREWALTIRRNF